MQSASNTVLQGRESALFVSPAQALTPLAACFGVACPVHDRCERYAAVDHSQADARTMGTCRTGSAFPLFVQSHRNWADSGAILSAPAFLPSGMSLDRVSSLSDGDARRGQTFNRRVGAIVPTPPLGPELQA